MARTYNAKGKHTSPENAGEQNITDIDNLPKDEIGLNEKLLGVREKGKANIYKGQWTDEALAESLDEFFIYCTEVDLKPTQPLLRIWLNMAKSTMHEWRTKPEKYGEKSNLINRAFDVMEAYLQGNIDKYPTGSIFLLKTSHGHIETSKMDITSNGQNITSTEEVKDLVGKLGLDKK